MTDLEILQSLPSLYPLKDYEEEAVLNVCKIFEDIKAEIKELSPTPTAEDVIDGNPIKDAIWETLIDVVKIIDKYISGKEGKE